MQKPPKGNEDQKKGPQQDFIPFGQKDNKFVKN